VSSTFVTSDYRRRQCCHSATPPRAGAARAAFCDRSIRRSPRSRLQCNQPSSSQKNCTRLWKFAGLGAIADQRYGFGEAAPLEALLGDAGFREVQSRRLSRTIRFKDGASFLPMNAVAFVGMSAAGKTMGDDEHKAVVEAITHDSEPVLQSYSDASGLAFELTTNLATARGYSI
jgi:hypothetical protein